MGPLAKGETLDGEPIKSATPRLLIWPISISANKSGSGKLPLTSTRGEQVEVINIAAARTSDLLKVIVFRELLLNQFGTNNGCNTIIAQQISYGEIQNGV